MASAIIHLAVAKELEKKLNIINKYDYYLGSIAPDIAKQIGKSKYESHFLKNSYKNNIPNMELFVSRYPNFMENAFELGYYIHLYTDKLWFEDCMEKITYNSALRLLDGTIINTTEEEIQSIIYSDYTNLNIKIIDEYNLDLSLFYEDFKVPKTDIKEIPVENLDILINKMGIIIENSKEEKKYSIDIGIIKEFITSTCNKIMEELDKY